MVIKYAADITSLNSKNKNQIDVQYKKTTSETWLTTKSENSYSLASSVIVSAETDSAYDIRVVVNDSFTCSIATTGVSTVFALMDFNASGKGIAFGKVSSYSNKMEIAMPLVVDTINDTNFTSLVNTANTAQSTANKANASANSAQSAANTAQSTANTANNTANSAVSRISSLEGLAVTSATGGGLLKVQNIYAFSDSNNCLLTGAKGNYIFGISAWSDSRLKKNIEDTKVDALQVINSIEMKSYDFIDEKFGTHQDIGYIAHQLKTVIPEAVMEVEQDADAFGYDSLMQVCDTAIIKYLVKAVQELTARIEKMEGEQE